MDDVRTPVNEKKDLSTRGVLDPNTNPNVQPQTDDHFTAGLSHVNLLGKTDSTIAYQELLKHLQKEPQFIRRSVQQKPKMKEDFVKKEKRNHKDPPYILFIIMSIVCFLFLKIMSYYISLSTNNTSISPSFDADQSCRSLDDGHTNSNLAMLPVSYPVRIDVSPAKIHQVFFNFRGEELRYNFVSHLGDAFERHDIKFFIDKNEQRGKDLNNLFVRIEESSIALAIFSTRYPESSWCMDELVKMKKLADQGKLQVIPIFYKVEAENVRKPTGDSEFGKNFWRLAEASSGDQIKNWKEALECISGKMGLSLGDNSSEADFIKDIVKAVQTVIEEKNFMGK